MVFLVTGGGGFIGSSIVRRILDTTDEEIVILDDFSTGNKSNINIAELDRIDVRNGDVRDQITVENVISEVDAVIHLAAAVGVKRIINNPLESLQTNIHGTSNVLKSTAEHNIPLFLASSSEVYGKSDNVPFAETDDRTLGPTNIPRWGYACSKAVDEHLSLSYHSEMDLPVVIGRYFNIVGPRQSGRYGMVIPRFVNQALLGEPLTVYGDGTQTRSFTHVEEAAEVTIELLDMPSSYGEVVNIGSPVATSINDLAERVIEFTDSDSEIHHVPIDEVYGDDFEEPMHREPDVTKLRELVGWVPETDLDRILRDVIAERLNGESISANDL